VEVRKVQLVGRASYSVTLPPDWIKEYNIKPSDQVTLTREEDGSLRLAAGITSEEAKEIKATIDADHYKEPGLLARLVATLYIRGCDSIEIVSKHAIGENHRKEIQGAIESLMGLGLVESTSNRVVLQCMIDPTKFTIKPLLKRLCALASSMYEDVMRALNDKDSSLATSVIQRKNEFDKIYALVQRQISASMFDKTVLKKIELSGTPDLAPYIAILPRIKSLSENFVDIANNQLAIGQKEVGDSDLQKIIRLGKMSQEIFSNAVEAFLNNDLALANRTMESITFEKAREELANKFSKSPRTDDPDLMKRLVYIVEDLRWITAYGKMIAHEAIAGHVFHKSILKF
jgi:phosphate uptake regulator